MTSKTTPTAHRGILPIHLGYSLFNPLTVLHCKLRTQGECSPWPAYTVQPLLGALRLLSGVTTSLGESLNYRAILVSTQVCPNLSPAGTQWCHHLQSQHDANVNIKHTPSLALSTHDSAFLTRRNPPCPSLTPWVLQHLDISLLSLLSHDRVLWAMTIKFVPSMKTTMYAN